MPTTNYSSIDLTNIIAISGPTFTNCSDIGSAPLTPNFSGTFNDPAINQASNYLGTARGEGIWSAVINHNTPTTIVPSNAKIRRIRMQMQFANNPVTASASITAFSTNSSAYVEATLQAAPEPINAPWITSFNTINDIDSDAAAGAPVTVSASINPPGEFMFFEYDFTTNPNGDFPLGYMTYADFITNFSVATFQIKTISEIQSLWSGAGSLTGNAAGGCALQASNWSMEVEWYVTLQWTLSPSTITLPDNIIELTRSAPIEPDDEQIEAVWIGDTKIEPDDPWVIVWTKILIRIHIPPDEVENGDKNIDVEIIGTQFSGRIPAGTLTITTADLSGIYQLDDSAFTDTLYDRSGSPVVTQEVAIPAPFFVTYSVNNNESDVLHFTGTRIKASGQGSLHQLFQSLDYIQTEQLNDIILRTSNNLVPFSLANFIDQQANVRVYMDTIEDFMKIDQIIIFYKKLFTGYPQ